jgi:hypothetical protein
MIKSRLAGPSEICAFDFKRDFRQLGIFLVSPTIDIDRPIFYVSSDDDVAGLIKKRPSGGTYHVASTLGASGIRRRSR